MFRPVRVTAPTMLPISVDEVKKLIRIDFDDDDEAIEQNIQSAVDHYEGWNGILGICLVEQEWRQDFEGFCSVMLLPLGPFISLSKITWRNADGVEQELDSNLYSVGVDDAGYAFVRFSSTFVWPSPVAEFAPVSVFYKAGFPIVQNKQTVPQDIRTAIAARVQMFFDQQGTDGSEIIERMEAKLIQKWQRLA